MIRALLSPVRWNNGFLSGRPLHVPFRKTAGPLFHPEEMEPRIKGTGFFLKNGKGKNQISGVHNTMGETMMPSEEIWPWESEIFANPKQFVTDLIVHLQ